MNQQQQHIEAYVTRNGWTLVKSYQDIGPRLNDKRRDLLQLLCYLPILQPKRNICSYEDRLPQFGAKLLQTICEPFSTKIVETQQLNQTSDSEQQLINDVIALLTSFAGKLH